jgi:hypothetical protein
MRQCPIWPNQVFSILPFPHKGFFFATETPYPISPPKAGGIGFFIFHNIKHTPSA